MEEQKEVLEVVTELNDDDVREWVDEDTRESYKKCFIRFSSRKPRSL
jgi:hypothetical protein